MIDSSTSSSLCLRANCAASPPATLAARALETIFGAGPIPACRLLAEVGDARRFKRSRQVIRASGLDPAVIALAELAKRILGPGAAVPKSRL